jgi:hypothetical protein
MAALSSILAAVAIAGSGASLYSSEKGRSDAKKATAKQEAKQQKLLDETEAKDKENERTSILTSDRASKRQRQVSGAIAAAASGGRPSGAFDYLSGLLGSSDSETKNTLGT